MRHFRGVLSIVIFLAVLGLASCRIPVTADVTSRDCTVPIVPAGFTRIFIGAPARGGQQSGASAKDPLDGTSVDRFDAILRTIAEGERPTWGAQKDIAPENLIVCLASGTFQTNGQYDWRFSIGHTLGKPVGFTMEKNWKIHGSGVSRTTLQLAGYMPFEFDNLNGGTFSGGRNVALGTHSPAASGIEISDLTIDANHDHLTPVGGPPLSLAAITLRSLQGGHWVHDVNVIGAGSDPGFTNIKYETFIVRIWGHSLTLDSSESTGNLVENVHVSKPGRSMANGSPLGGAADGIVVSNAKTEVRNNVVEGYQIGYGGWNMNEVWFHNNIARNTHFGFNTDSLTNTNVILESNQFIHPLSYGIVIGGDGTIHTFAGWKVINNTVQLNAPSSLGIILRGQVQRSVFSGNTIQSDGGTASDSVALLSFAAQSGLANLNNAFQNNHIEKSMRIDFSQDPNFNSNCRFNNRDLQGQLRQDFPDNSSTQCR